MDNGPSDSPEAIARDIATVARIDAVPTLLRVICETTGMNFSAVARVTSGTWTVCAVDDSIGFGLPPGGQLDLHTTLCKESREARAPVFFDQASASEKFRDHHTPRIYNIESYISIPIVLPSGEYFGNLCAIDPRPARVSDPKVVAMFTRFADLIAIEISNDRASAAQLGELIEERATARLREQFIAILGHDLRGPLSAIGMSAEYLAAPKLALAPEARDVALRVRRSVVRMQRLIDDVLDFARARMGGGFAVNLGTVHDVGLALRQVVTEFEQSHPGRRFVVDIDSPTDVLCDRNRLQQLASNLIANALAHGSPSGPVTVTAKVTEGLILLSVGNEGAPIPADRLPVIFEPFRRLAPGADGLHDGLGLGLFICSEIVRAHGGQLDVTSSADAGTTFTARLPNLARIARPDDPIA